MGLGPLQSCYSLMKEDVAMCHSSLAAYQPEWMKPQLSVLAADHMLAWHLMMQLLTRACNLRSRKCLLSKVKQLVREARGADSICCAKRVLMVGTDWQADDRALFTCRLPTRDGHSLNLAKVEARIRGTSKKHVVSGLQDVTSKSELSILISMMRALCAYSCDIIWVEGVGPFLLLMGKRA